MNDVILALLEKVNPKTDGRIYISRSFDSKNEPIIFALSSSVKIRSLDSGDDGDSNDVFDGKSLVFGF